MFKLKNLISLLLVLSVLTEVYLDSNFYLNRVRRKSGSFVITGQWNKTMDNMEQKYIFLEYIESKDNYTKIKTIFKDIKYYNSHGILGEIDYIACSEVKGDTVYYTTLSASYGWKRNSFSSTIDTSLYFLNFFYRIPKLDEIRTLYVNDEFISKEEYESLFQSACSLP